MTLCCVHIGLAGESRDTRAQMGFSLSPSLSPSDDPDVHCTPAWLFGATRYQYPTGRLALSTRGMGAADTSHRWRGSELQGITLLFEC